ncbi:MAG: group II intron maturase-specific domain-containing protein [Bryobacteraceae bacterium]
MLHTRRRKGDSMGKRIEELRRYLIGWRGYFDFWQTSSVRLSLTLGFADGCAVSSGFNGRRGVGDSMNSIAGAWNGSWRPIPLAATMVNGA